MKILAESNLNNLFKDNKTIAGHPMTVDLPGTLEKTSIKASWMNLGEVVKIETFKESRSGWGNPSLVPAISSYTFEVTIWKVVALLLFSPIFFIQGLVGNADPLFTKEVKVEEDFFNVKKTLNGAFELQISPTVLNS